MSVTRWLAPGLEPRADADLVRPSGADEHRSRLLAQLPQQLANVLTEPLGPLGLVGAAGSASLRERDSLTAALLRDFSEGRTDLLPEWDFGI